MSQTEKITNVSCAILRTIKENDLSRYVLIGILKGLKSRQIMRSGFYRSSGYGALYWLTQDAIKDILKQLEKQELIEVIDKGHIFGIPYRVEKIRLTAARSGRVLK